MFSQLWQSHINSFDIMQGGGSRKIEGRANIQRPGQFDYINTTYLPPEKTIHAVRYYNRRKEELRMNSYTESNRQLPSKDPKAENLRNQIDNALKNSRYKDSHTNKHIKDVKVEAVLPNNNPNTFDEANYHIEQEQRVQVVEEKYFTVQSYYTYIYETELKKQMNKFVDQTEKKVKEVVQDQIGQTFKPQQNGITMQKSQHYIDDKLQRQINGKNDQQNNQNRYNSKVGYSKAQRSIAVNELVPIHTNYTTRPSQQSLLFTVNQNKRLELSRRR